MAQKLSFIFLVSVLLFTAVVAGDLAGKWNVKSVGSYGETYQLTMTLEKDGDGLSGSLYTPVGTSVLENVKIESEKLFFEVLVDGTNYKAEMKITDAGMEGTASSGGEKFTLSAVRAKN